MARSTPYRAHVLVCVTQRPVGEPSCAHQGHAVRAYLKEGVRARGLEGVRVSRTLCLGQCAHGPNVMIYPQDRWLTGVRVEDTDAILDELERSLEERTPRG